MGIRGDQVKQVGDLLGQGKSIEEIATTVGLDIGDIQSVLSGATRTYVETLEGGLPSTGGAATPGGLRVIKFEVAHDTPGRDTGLTVWTPAVGDLLYDAWFDLHVMFDGSAYADINTDGGFAEDGTGLFGFYLSNGPAHLFGTAETTEPMGAGDAGYAVQQQGDNSLGPLGGTQLQWNTVGGNVQALTQLRRLPFRFTAADPLKLYVNGGGAPAQAADGSTAGSATLYLAVASPATA